MTTPQTYPLKRGATLSLAGTVLLPAGTWTATSQVKQLLEGVLVDVATLDVDLTPLGVPTASATHAITIVGTSLQTAAWPLARLHCDVRFADADTPPAVVASPTFIVNVTQEVTDE